MNRTEIMTAEMDETEAIEGSLRKWNEALRQTAETYIDWWSRVGSNKCDMCVFYAGKIGKIYWSRSAYNYCSLCPLHSSGHTCYPAWDSMHSLYDSRAMTYDKFIVLAKEMRDAIAKILEAKKREQHMLKWNEDIDQVNRKYIEKLQEDVTWCPDKESLRELVGADMLVGGSLAATYKQLPFRVDAVGLSPRRDSLRVIGYRFANQLDPSSPYEVYFVESSKDLEVRLARYDARINFKEEGEAS